MIHFEQHLLNVSRDSNAFLRSICWKLLKCENDIVDFLYYFRVLYVYSLIEGQYIKPVNDIAKPFGGKDSWEAVLWPGSFFTNDILLTIRIRVILRLTVIPLLAVRSQRILHMPQQHSCRWGVRNFAITVLKSRWEWNEISIKFELRWKPH